MKQSPTPQDIEGVLHTGLRERGYKVTSQRKAILHYLAMDLSHPSAADLLKKVRKAVPQISLSTVYYTLDILKKEGLIQELEFYDRDNRYDINVTNHINLICRKCGRIEDFPGAIPYSYTQVKERTAFQPVGMRFEYYGFCRTCRKMQKMKA